MVDAWGQLLIRVKQRGPCLPTGVDVISGDMLEELLEAATGEDTSHPTLVDADFTGVTFRGVADFGARPVGARPVWRSPTPEEEIAVGFLGLGARIVALSGIGSDSIGVWDIATREELGRLRLGFSEQFTGAISATIDWIDGQTVVITKDAGGRLGAWDLDTGRQVELVSDWAEVVAVDHGKIAIGDKAQVKVHDALTGDGVGTPVNRQSGDITAAAIGALFPPGRVHRIVATGESDGTVRVWDSETGEQIGETYVPLKAMWQTPSYQRAVQALTVGQVGEQSVVVIASGDESVRMWDPLTGDVIGEPYVADVTSVATGQIDRRNVAALACSDGAVRLLWRGAIPAGATTFRGTARFDRTTFEGETSFAGCYFADAASFTGTRFKHGVSFDRAAFRGQQISFATAAFEGRASFEAAEFYEGGDFTRASFADARLSGTRERFLRLVSFADCDMQNVALQHVDLRECRFGGATSLDRLQMSGWIAFAGVRETLADETAWRNAVSLPRRLLLQVIRSRRKKPWRTRPYSRKDRLQDEETREQEEVADLFRGPRVARRARLEADRQEARQIAGLYRELRKSREEARNEPGAADFYYGEMEMRRYSDHLGPGLLVSLYWAVSGYGLRPIRSLFWLGILTLGSAYAFLQWGLKTDLSFVDAWLRTLSITVNLQTFEHADLTQPGQALQILIRVLGPLLYGLTVLAIRGRVKR